MNQDSLLTLKKKNPWTALNEVSVAPPPWQWRLFFCWFCSLLDAFPNSSPGFSLYQLTDTRGNSWLKIKLSGLLKFSLVLGDLEFWFKLDPTQPTCA